MTASKVIELPEREEFVCPECKRSCIIHPRGKPVSVQHALPACALWLRVARGEEDLERFLIKAGAHLLLPSATSQ